MIYNLAHSLLIQDFKPRELCVRPLHGAQERRGWPCGRPRGQEVEWPERSLGRKEQVCSPGQVAHAHHQEPKE